MFNIKLDTLMTSMAVLALECASRQLFAHSSTRARKEWEGMPCRPRAIFAEVLGCSVSKCQDVDWGVRFWCLYWFRFGYTSYYKARMSLWSHPGKCKTQPSFLHLSISSVDHVLASAHMVRFRTWHSHCVSRASARLRIRTTMSW